MKKTLAILLALMTVMSISLTACNKNKKNTENTSDDEGDYFFPTNQSTNTANPSDSDTPSTGSNTGSTVSKNWVEKNDTVYVAHLEVNVRSDANSKASILGTATFGQSFTRTKSNGSWDCIQYGSNEAYIASYLLTTVKGNITFKDVEEKAIHVKEGNQINLRTSPCYDEALKNLGASGVSDKATANGELVIIGINESGNWLKVKFTGKDSSGTDFKDSTKVFYCRPTYIVEYAGTASGGSDLAG